MKIKSFDHTEETGADLVGELKNQLTESNNAGELSPGLVTVLRIIQSLCLPPDNQFVLGAKIELKYDYILLKLYSDGIFPLLIGILEVNDLFLTSDHEFIRSLSNRNVRMLYYVLGRSVYQ